MPTFFGKYRGKIVANKDPLHLGRIQVEVPAIFGEGRQSWAMPCTPYAGKDIGFFTVPPVDSNVWVEFEGGDPDYPIWSGCFWGQDELPQNAKVEEPDKVQVLRTPYGITLTLSNFGDNKGVTLEVESPTVQRKLKMVFNADGIELNNQDDTTIKIKADIIELKNRANSTITITADSIQDKQTSTETTLTANSIELKCPAGNIKLTASTAIELSNTTNIKMTPAQIELSNGAANIKMSPASVNVNNGALEVI